MDKRRGRKVHSRRKINEYKFVDGHVIMYLERKGETFESMIDYETYYKVKDYRWILNPYGYVVSDTFSREHGVLFLHQHVIGKKEGFIIDHINQNRLDNRRENLRYASKSANALNSKVKGVSFRKDTNKWSAMVVVDGKRKSLGCFVEYEDAKRVRDEYVKGLEIW